MFSIGLYSLIIFCVSSMEPLVVWTCLLVYPERTDLKVPITRFGGDVTIYTVHLRLWTQLIGRVIEESIKTSVGLDIMVFVFYPF